MGTHAIIVSKATMLPAEYNVWALKLGAIHLRMFAGFCFNISAPPQILAASTVFFCPIPETKK